MNRIEDFLFYFDSLLEAMFMFRARIKIKKAGIVHGIEK
ncbi:MAG: hypothetical protein ACJA09_002979 [Alcanivorax sp.]|jgi:hypothetical protein